MMNPLNFLQMIRSGKDPQQLMINFLAQQQDNPMAQNLLNMAKNGQGQDIEQVARNYCAQQGKDFDTEFTNFRQWLGL